MSGSRRGTITFRTFVSFYMRIVYIYLPKLILIRTHHIQYIYYICLVYGRRITSPRSTHYRHTHRHTSFLTYTLTYPRNVFGSLSHIRACSAANTSHVHAFLVRFVACAVCLFFMRIRTHLNKQRPHTYVCVCRRNGKLS